MKEKKCIIGVGTISAEKSGPQLPYIDTRVNSIEFTACVRHYFLQAIERMGMEAVLFDEDNLVATKRVVLSVTFGVSGGDDTFSDKCGVAAKHSMSNAFERDSRLLAMEIYAKLLAGNEHARGVSEDNMPQLANVFSPAVYVEAGNLSALYDASRMLDSDFCKAIAEQTMQGIAKFLHLNYTPARMEKLNILQLDCSGAEVEYLQCKLKSKLYYCGKIDGVFGEELRQAVLLYQAENDLPQTGVISYVCWAKLLGKTLSKRQEKLLQL